MTRGRPYLPWPKNIRQMAGFIEGGLCSLVAFVICGMTWRTVTVALLLSVLMAMVVVEARGESSPEDQ